MTVIIEFTKLAKMVAPGKPFQPSLTFSSKARAYPSEAPELSQCNSITMPCHYAECRYAEFRVLFNAMLNAIMLSVFMPDGSTVKRVKEPQQ
jgi:hypothetical protein